MSRVCCVAIFVLGTLPAARIGAAEIRGTVDAVDGKTVTLKLEGSTVPAAGDRVEIVATIPGLDEEARVAVGRVTRAAAARATVQIDRATGTVSPGQRAKITATDLPALAPPPGAPAVPDVTGLAAAEAKKKLQAAGLEVSFRSGEPAATVDMQYVVYRQVPAGGAAAQTGETVELTIYGQVRGAAEPELAPAVDVPTAADRQITTTVARILADQHVSRRGLDDEISRRFLENYLQTLDPVRVYFNQSDVDRFSRVATDLDDLARKGDLGPAYQVFETYIHRVDQRVATVGELLASDLDFDRRETMVTDPARRSYPRDDRDARELWRKRVKYDLLVAMADGLDREAAVEKIARRYESFRRRMYQLTGDELLEMYLTALCHAFDPHSTYLSPATVKNMRIQQGMELDGIGAALRSEDGNAMVASLVPGGPAQRDGRLRPEDCILGVGEGPSGEMVDVVDMKLADVVEKVRGPRGSTVRLRVQPAAGGPTAIYAIVRGKIELEGIRAKVFERARGSKTFQVGYVELSSLYGALDGQPGRSSSEDLRHQLNDFRTAGADVVVLDLRRNGGGSLAEAIAATGLFLAGGPVVLVRGRDGNVQTHADPAPEMTWDGPLVVLTSRVTASGAEILAAAVQDFGRGLILGDRATHGNGTVAGLLDVGQQLFGSQPDRPSLGALKLVRAMFYRPSGNSVQLGGVAPDVTLPSMTDAMDLGTAFLDHPLSGGTVARAAYEKLHFAVDQSLRAELSERSKKRRGQSADFQTLGERIALYQERKLRTEVSLHGPTFRAERNAVANKPSTPNRSTGGAVEADFYLDEVFEISLDYLSRQQLARARQHARERRYAEAWKEFAKAVHADPTNATAAYYFAWALATCPDRERRNGQVAVGYARLGCKLTGWKSWTHLLALAAAHAEAGEFDEAVSRLDEALDLAPADRRASYEYLRERFRNKQSYGSR